MNEKVLLPPPIDFKKIKKNNKINYFNPHEVINNNISLPRIVVKESDKNSNKITK